jgi:hypothetical protein
VCGEGGLCAGLPPAAAGARMIHAAGCVPPPGATGDHGAGCSGRGARQRSACSGRGAQVSARDGRPGKRPVGRSACDRGS